MYNVIKSEVNNIPVVIIETGKFKTITLQIQLRSKMTRDRVTARNLLSQMMIKRTDRHKGEAELMNHLAHYYGAHLTTGASRKGQDHIVSFAMEFVNDKFIKEDMNVPQEMCTVLNEVLKTPFNYDGAFQAFFEREKRLYKNRLKSMKDNRAQASFQAMVDTMFEHEDYKYLPHGVLEDIDALTLDDVKAEHKKMMAEDDMVILAAGSVNESITEELSLIYARETPVEQTHQPYPHAAVGEVKRETDHQQIEQAKLNMGFRADLDSATMRMAFNVLNQMFGGSPSSYLFSNIREKQSLAYQIGSQIDMRNGYMFVMGGVDPENLKKAETGILEELERFRNGDFKDEFLNEIKGMMRVNRKEIMDKPKGLIALEYNHLLKSEGTPSWEAQLESVDREMIIEVSRNVKLDTIYVLRESEKNEAD
ncbi:EF-P 5-aminopentanol modification-associated protein YfmF [Salinicoccus albus]|uniref:EF-P 5-aminopentanol modification-associated protein YfmF n=1 Tax=Salinicoccus albus TaxID=418756 RepID=UPI0003686E11|nr:insulinase family protein [Salinicoccus albus]